MRPRESGREGTRDPGAAFGGPAVHRRTDRSAARAKAATADGFGGASAAARADGAHASEETEHR
jgi:hypothetical protein